jgi:Tol biopolymer transport system component
MHRITACLRLGLVLLLSISASIIYADHFSISVQPPNGPSGQTITISFSEPNVTCEIWVDGSLVETRSDIASYGFTYTASYPINTSISFNCRNQEGHSASGGFTVTADPNVPTNTPTPDGGGSGGGGDTSGDDSSPGPNPVTPQPTLPPVPSTGNCVLRPDGYYNVNVRAEASTDSDVITVIDAYTLRPVNSGVISIDGNIWWNIEANGHTGWVAGWVTITGGDCSAIGITIGAIEDGVVVNESIAEVNRSALVADCNPNLITADDLEGFSPLILITYQTHPDRCNALWHLVVQRQTGHSQEVLFTQGGITTQDCSAAVTIGLINLTDHLNPITVDYIEDFLKDDVGCENGNQLIQDQLIPPNIVDSINLPDSNIADEQRTELILLVCTPALNETEVTELTRFLNWMGIDLWAYVGDAATACAISDAVNTIGNVIDLSNGDMDTVWGFMDTYAQLYEFWIATCQMQPEDAAQRLAALTPTDAQAVLTQGDCAAAPTPEVTAPPPTESVVTPNAAETETEATATPIATPTPGEGGGASSCVSLGVNINDAIGVFVGSNTSNGAGAIYLITEGTECVLLHQNGVVYRYPVFDPRGERIVYLQTDANNQTSLQMVDFATQQPTTLLHDSALAGSNQQIAMYQPAWSRDGETLLITLVEHNVLGIYALDMRNPSSVPQRLLGSAMRPIYAPQDEHILFERIVSDGTHYVALVNEWDIGTPRESVITMPNPEGTAACQPHTFAPNFQLSLLFSCQQNGVEVLYLYDDHGAYHSISIVGAQPAALYNLSANVGGGYLTFDDGQTIYVGYLGTAQNGQCPAQPNPMSVPDTLCVIDQLNLSSLYIHSVEFRPSAYEIIES